MYNYKTVFRSLASSTFMHLFICNGTYPEIINKRLTTVKDKQKGCANGLKCVSCGKGNNRLFPKFEVWQII